MKARKELKEFRTPNSKRFLNKDGTIQVELYKEPIHYKSDNGQYEEIDNTFEETTTGVKNKRNDFIVEFDEKNENCLLNISSKGHKLCMYPKKVKVKQRDKKSTKGNKKRRIDRVKYEGILDNTDIEYELRSKSLKESIVLHEKPKNNIIEFILKTDLELSINTDNSIYIYNGKEKLFKLEKPFMIDNKKSYSESIKYEIEKNKNEYEIRMVLDKEWIMSKDREYPIIIDPTITGVEESNSVIDTYIFDGDTDTTTYNQNKLLVGTDENNISYRSLLKFNLPIIPAGYKMVNAELVLYSVPEYGDYAFNDKKILIQKINKPWSQETAKWSNMNDAYDSRIYDYTLSTKSLYYAENDEMKINWGGTTANITNLVQEWYNDYENNYGVMLRWQDETFSTSNNVCEFISNEYLEENLINSTKPILSITYKDFNGLEDYLTYSSMSHFFGSSNICNYTGNLTTIFNLGNTIDEKMPVNFSLIYNTNDIITNKNYGFGLGVKPNLYQTLEIDQFSLKNEDETIIIYDVIKYNDDNGTMHYFIKNTEDNAYYDEENLGITITLNENYCLMDDKNGNSKKFILQNDIYYLKEITNVEDFKTQIEYDSNNRIISIIDHNNNSVNIQYSTNSITIQSPHIQSIIYLTNNQLTSISQYDDIETIVYTDNNLIKKIINPNGQAIEYEYLNDITFKVNKISEISKIGTIGKYLTFEYNLNVTKITDNKGKSNTYIFDSYGNTTGIIRVDSDNDLSKAYGKTNSFNSEGGNVHKLSTDLSLVQYVDNLIDNSSFEENESNIFTNNDINTSNVQTMDYSNSGLKSLKVDISGFGGEISKEFEVEKGKTYTFSAYVRGSSLVNENEQSGVDFILSYDDINSTTNITELTNEFIRHSVSIDYSINAVENLKLSIKNSTEAQVSFYLDDIQLEEGDVANYYNLVTNSGFKNGTNGWNINITSEIEGAEPREAEVTVESEDNNKVLKMHSFPSDNIYITKTFNISGQEGDTFNLSFWYKNEGIIPSGYIGMHSGILANIFFNYGDEYLEGTGIPAKLLNVGTDNWQFFSQNFIAESNYENITLQILSSSNANDCYITNFTLFKDLEQYSYQYDENDNLIAASNINKNETTITYNKNNNMEKIYSDSGISLTYEYDEQQKNKKIRTISQSGLTNKFEYDNNGNLINNSINAKTITENLENEKKYYIRAKGSNKYFYVKSDKNIRLKRDECSYDKFQIITIEENQIKIKHAILNNYYLKEQNGNLVLSYGDNLNIFKLIRNSDYSFSIQSTISNKVITINETYNLILSDYLENDIKQQFFFENSEELLYIESRKEYTLDGRFVISETNQDGNVTNYELDEITGNTKKIIDSNNIETIINYDYKNRISDIIKQDQKVSYQYTNTNLSKITHGQKEYTFEYNEFDNIDSVKINNNLLIKNQYENSNGNLIKVTYGNANEIKYYYDKFDRLKIIEKMNDQYTYSYDNLNRISRIMSQDDHYNYEYDFAKRLSSYKYNDYKTNYDYGRNNLLSSKIEEINGAKHVYNYEYDSEKNLVKIVNDTSEFNINYDKLGRINEKNINNYYKSRYSYASKGNKTSITLEKFDDNGVIYTFEYDKMGNVIKIKKNNITIKEFIYDIYYQLIQENDYEEDNYIINEYDNNGNIIFIRKYNYSTSELLSERKYSYDNINWEDLLTKYNNENITYDEIGNPITIGNKNLSWKNGREMSSYIDLDNNINITYKYNKDGIRTSKIVNGKQVNYIIEGNNIIFENNDNNMIYYIRDNDELLGFYYLNNIYYYHKNQYNDIIGILDSNYNEIVSYKYDNWGEIIDIQDNSNINLSEINPFRYRSYYYDNETDLYYINSRYYNPKWHRFINADALINANKDIISNNLFNYVGNNPVGRMDYNGQWLLEIGVLVTVILLTTGCSDKSSNNNIKGNYGAARKYEEIKGYKNGINCYAYALGDNKNRQPGDVSNRNPKIYDVYDVGRAVEADMKKEGRSIRVIDGPNGKINENEYRIALRVGTKPHKYNFRTMKYEYDYHFMVQTNTGQWAEKHGAGGGTVLWDHGKNPDNIPWSLNDNKHYYDSDIIYYAIGI